MSKQVIFTKTALGRTEMEARSGKLNPRQRRALIFIDGKLTVDELRERLAADDLSHTLGMLEEEGYIEVLGMREDTASEIAPAPERLPSITAFRPLPDVPATPTLDLARNFMLNTLRAFSGSYSCTSLQDAIMEAPSHATLREHFNEWYHVVVSTRDGRRRAEELRGKLLEVI